MKCIVEIVNKNDKIRFNNRRACTNVWALLGRRSPGGSVRVCESELAPMQNRVYYGTVSQDGNPRGTAPPIQNLAHSPAHHTQKEI